MAQVLLLTSAIWICQLASTAGLESSEARAEDAVGGSSSVAGNPTAAKEASPLQNLLSNFDSYEETKSGKKLPKAYLRSVRKVVSTLRVSLLEETSEGSKFRKGTESAKEAIREYLGTWKGVSTVAAEESYLQVETALRELSAFYSKKGPRAAVPQDVKDRLLSLLDKAQESL